MKTLVAILVLVAFSAVAGAEPRFVAMDVYIDANAPLAAWQFELNDRNGVMTIVGVENGDSAAFADAPYYDRGAVEAGDADRIVVADFSLDEGALPSGRVRIATLHLMLDGGEPDYTIKLVTATTRDGARIDASITLQAQTGSST